MEDDQLKDLFSNFDPELSSDSGFMDKLQRNLNSVEMIRQQTAELRRRNRKSMIIAAFVGFIAGISFSSVIPYISQMMSSVRLTLPSDSAWHILVDNYLTVTWFVIGVASVLMSINAYDLSLSLLKSRSSGH